MAQHQWNGEHTWTVGEPITQEKMNSIEGGIAEALEQQSAIDALDSRLDKIDGGSILTDTKNLKQQVSEAAEKASQALGAANTAQAASSDGQIALAQIQGALARTDGEGNPIDPYDNLATRLAEDQTAINNKISQTNSNISSVQTNMGLVSEEVRNARSTLKFNGSNATAQNLRAKIDDMDFQITANQGAISSITTSYNSSMTDISGVTHNSLADRLNSMENNTKDVADEVEDARGTYTDLDARLDTDETAIGNLETNKIPYSDIVADLTTNNDNKPLAASQGRELKQTIGGAYSSSSTVATGIANAEQNAKDYTDTKLGSGFDSTNTVAARIDAIDNASTGTIHGLDTRISALETEIDMTSANSRIDLVETEVNDAHRANVNNDTLDNRFDDIESAITTLNGNAQTSGSVLNTVNAQIAAVVNSAPETFDTLGEIAAWIQNDTSGAAAMQQAISNNTGAISALDTRLTAIDNSTNGRMKVAEDDIDALETALGNTNSGLTQRVGTLEATIGDNTSGLVKDVADNTQAVVNINTAISHTASGNDPGGLTQRITALESEPKSATVVIDNTHITYNEGVPTSIGETPSEDKDYLLQGAAPDDKYYYWKYIGNYPNGTWNLISGGGGNGNTSGVVLSAADYNDPNYTKVINTDYYVLESDGYHHYRWIPTNIVGELEEIEIGEVIDTDQIKRYRVARHERSVNGENTVFLDFYEFDYKETAEINDEDHSENRIAAIELPKGGGEITSDATCIVSYVSPQSQTLTQESANTNGVKISFFYQAYEKSDEDYITQMGTYTLKKGSRIIDSGNINSAPVETDEQNNPVKITEQYKQDHAKTIDITKYCTANEPADFVLSVTSTSGISRTRPFHVEIIELNLRSTFNSQTIFDVGSTIRIPLVITSPERDKTIYITIDKDTEDEYTFIQTHGAKASSNTTVILPTEKITPGLHSINIYFEEIISGNNTAPSNELSFDIACRDPENDVILLSSSYRNKIITIEQYQTLKIPYYLYIPTGIKANIVKINSATNKTTVEEGTTGTDTFIFKASQASITENEELIPYTLTIGCQVEGSQTLDPVFTVQVKVTPNIYNIEPVIDGLVFDFNPVGYINNPQNEEDKYWKDENNPSIKLSEVEGENFDWDNGGWKYDEEKEAPYFCIKAGSRAQINYSLFQDNMETNGSEFKCIFKAMNVRDPEAVFLTSVDQVASTIINYDSDVVADDQDVEDNDTLLSNYLNVKEGHVLTYKKGKIDADKLAITIIDGTTIVLPDDADPEDEIDTSYIMTDAGFTSALNKAKNKVISKNTTAYANTIVGYVEAYDGEDAAALSALIPDAAALDTKAKAEAISNTLKENAEWASFRETTTYESIMVDLPTLIKNYALTYDTSVVITNKFTEMIVEDDHIDEYAQRIVKNVHAVVKNNEEEVIKEQDSQIEIIYELDENENIVYKNISLIRPILSTEERSRGLEMRAHRANIHLGSGTLTYPYSEGDIIEFEYNISKPLVGKKTAPILMYEDGVPSASMLYSTGSNALRQTTKGNLILGSDDCDIWIYRLKFYNKQLDNIDILSNFYADALKPDDMIDRYERNIATYTDSSDPDSITPQSIAASCPGLRVIMIEAPNLTGGKNSFIKNSKIRCIYKGEDARPEDNWVALNAYHAGQGTSSDAYGASGRNLDIIFGFDGIDQLIAPKAKNNYRFDPDYKSILITGVDDNDNSIGTADDYINEILNNLNDGKFDTDEDYLTKQDLLALESKNFTDKHLHMYLDGTGKVNFTDESVPNAWFNIKLNIASSENTNNALLQKRYDRYLKEIYQTPAQKRGNKEGLLVKNSMEFFNCIVFIREVGDPTEFTDDSSIPVANRQWHFYGIGNIGDSKKTDNTRINIPDDPYEFAVEISDNGLKNSGFSSGVYWTDKNHTSTTYNPSEGYEIKYPVTMEEWTNENNTTYAALIDYKEDGGWDSSLEFRYDVSTKDGNTIADSDAEKALATARQEHNKEVYKNMYEWVVTAPTSGDNSFNNHLRDWFIEDSPLYWYIFTERYTMIDSRAKNTFYHYGKVYASAEEVDGETAAECTRVQACQAALTNALEGDDEAAIAAAQTAYDTAVFVWQNKDCFITPSDNKYYETSINGVTKGAAEINDGYRFDLWDYDNDTALGINNNGQMVFDAGLEDIDRTANAWVYNEATSVFWCRVRDELYNKLRSTYTSRRADCFNAENLIKEFDEWQEQFPENLWRMDFERKYYRPYKDGNNMRYLRDMANGRKKYQRREFERNMCIYIDSKYVLTDAYNPNDFIQFRPTAQQDENQDKMVNITLYSPMYINFSIGNQSNTPGSHVRCLAGQTKSFNFYAGITDSQNIQSKIFNASRIKIITGLENYYADDLDFTAASKLRKITLGSDVVKIVNSQGEVVSTIPYRNNNTKTLVLGEGNPILEELDIRNCTALAPILDLSECVSLAKLYAIGTPLTEVLLAPGGLIKELYLPASMTTLTFNNLYLLDTVQLAGYNNIVSYTSYNIHKYNSQTLINNILSHLTHLEMNDINWTIDTIYDLDIFEQLQKTLGTNMHLEGTIYISHDWSQIEIDHYGGKSTSVWPNVTIIPLDPNAEIIKYKITYRYDSYIDSDGNIVPPQEITEVYVQKDTRVPDIYATGLIEQPTRTPTVRNTFSFGARNQAGYITNSGWKAIGASSYYTTMPMAEQGLIVETYFTTAVRRYPVKWYLTEEDYNNNEPVATSSSQVVYGGGESLEAPTVKDIHNAGKNTVKVEFVGNNVNYKIFTGWEKLPINIAPAASDEAYNIFGTWKTVTDKPLSTLFPDYGENEEVPEPTPEQLLVLSRMNEQQRNNCPGVSKIVSSAHMTYTMGNDSKETGIDLINNAYGNSLGYDVLRFDLGTAAAATNIQPLSSTNDAFTIMIDYTFNANATYATGINQAILMSCYYQNSAQNVVTGFVLYNNLNSSLNTTGPRIGFGNMFNESMYSKPVGTVGSRNILVLRHPAGSSKLYIYSGLSGNSVINSSYDDALEIEWNNSTSNAYINFGQLTNDTSLEYYNLKQVSTTASGTIYKAKYWNKDLGIGECKRLAAWPHESMTVAISKIKSTQTTGEQRDVAGVMVPTIGLTTITTSNHGYITHDNSSWGASNYNTICNNRIFNGLPIELQSILSRPMIRYLNVTSTSDGSGGYSYALGNLSSVPAYIYMPSAYNMSSSATNYITEDNAEYETAPFEWIVNTNVATYNYNSSNTWTRDTSDTSQYMNMRFPIKPLNSSIRVFREVSNSFSNSTTTTIMDEIAKLANNVLEGDIFIDISGNAYIYVSNSDIMDLGAQMQPESGIFATNGNGGWVASRGYWLRSLMVPDQWTGTIRSTFVNKTGTVYTVYNSNNTPDASGLSINYSMTI